MKSGLIGALLLIFGYRSVDAMLIPNNDSDSTSQCGYTVARLIESPLQSTTLFPEDMPVCGTSGGDANENFKEEAGLVESKAAGLASIIQSADLATLPAADNP
jgi:hypothetical protein